jgi:hypothetical protein
VKFNILHLSTRLNLSNIFIFGEFYIWPGVPRIKWKSFRHCRFFLAGFDGVNGMRWRMFRAKNNPVSAFTILGIFASEISMPLHGLLMFLGSLLMLGSYTEEKVRLC